MFCKNCGAELNDSLAFCPHCGKKTNGQYEESRTYDGKIKKCPNCGEILSAFTTRCLRCGYELRDSTISNSVSNFKEKLDDLNGLNNDRDLARFISTYPVSNTREDILEFFMLAKSNIYARILDDELDIVDTAWVALFDNVYSKAKLIINDPNIINGVTKDYIELNKKIDEIIKKTKNNTKNKILEKLINNDSFQAILVFSCLLLMMWLMFFILSSLVSKEDNYLKSIVNEIEIDIKNKDFTSARFKANKLRYRGSDDEDQKTWDKQREEILKLIDEEIAKNKNK